MQLSAPALRVLGTLMEKAMTTPEIYPLSLNSLVNACNQKTSREPVTDYDESEVLAALDELRGKQLAMRVDMAGSRTAKFRENATTTWELRREEYALIAVLMLRGGQTPGQLRRRCERLYPFAELQQVNDWLRSMQTREEAPNCMVEALPHAPGTKEIRWVHTLGEEQQHQQPPEPVSFTRSPAEPKVAAAVQGDNSIRERLDRLEQRVQELESLFNEYTS